MSFNVRANGVVVFITTCPEELEEYLDKYAEISHRHGYELAVNGRSIQPLEHPIPSILRACIEGTLP